MEFFFTVPPAITFGPGCSKKVGEVVNQLGYKNVFVVYDAGVKAAGIVDPIVEALKAANLNVVEYDKVLANPPIECVEEGATLARNAGSEIVVAIGGGSAMDTAKCVNVLLSNPSPLTLYEGVNNVKNRTNPLIAIPTTAGTGSEVTTMAIITDEANKRKFAVHGQYVGAAIALVDPELTLGLPPFITATTGVDALTHAIEAYISKMNMIPADVMALKAIELIIKNLPEATKNGKNLEARSNMMLGSLMAGIAFTNAMVTLAHSIAHPLGARCNTAHGLANACVLPYVVEFNVPAVPQRIKDIGVAMGLPVQNLSDGDAAKAVVEALIALNKELGIPSLEGAKVPKDILPTIAEDVMKEPPTFFNPRECTPEEVLAILNKAY
ncbi:MAG: iron-containing alcohol dehydrogenase [Peptococcaceae bacterium]|nr:iron-containing alcohol dehydrogenase [Peptococcaceae bacterium]